MKQLMLERFLPEDYEQIQSKMYIECVKGKRSVTEYTTEFCLSLNVMNWAKPRIRKWLVTSVD